MKSRKKEMQQAYYERANRDESRVGTCNDENIGSKPERGRKLADSSSKESRRREGEDKAFT